MEMKGDCWPTTTAANTTTIGTSGSGEEMKRKSTSKKASSSASGKASAYRGVRMRKWGKWVSEIREPKKKTRIWLGSYSTPLAAARSYDTAAYLIHGRSAKLNFPEETAMEMADTTAAGAENQLSADSIRKKASQVGARIDALQMGQGLVSLNNQRQQQPPAPRQQRPDLNLHPPPDSLDDH